MSVINYLLPQVTHLLSLHAICSTDFQVFHFEIHLHMLAIIKSVYEISLAKYACTGFCFSQSCTHLHIWHIPRSIFEDDSAKNVQSKLV